MSHRLQTRSILEHWISDAVLPVLPKSHIFFWATKIQSYAKICPKGAWGPKHPKQGWVEVRRYKP